MALAITAHASAGGTLPGHAALTLLTLCAGLAGCAAAGLHARAQSAGDRNVTSRGNESFIVAALLLTAQLGGHIALSCGHPVSLSWGMLGGHLLAAASCAVLIVLSERLYAAARRAVHALTVIPAAPSWSRLGAVCTGRRHWPRHDGHRRASPRGPPWAVSSAAYAKM